MEHASSRPLNSALIDPYGRRIDYLRVSVTDRCDLRCSYCLPKDFRGYEEPAHWLRHDETARLVGLFATLGVGRVRLTGGEPLLRRGLSALAAALAALPGVDDLSLSTNATRLAEHATALRAAGVTRLNVSLDTLDAACFARITGRDCLAQVLAGLEAARAAGFAPIKLNMVVQQAVNLAEVARVLDYAIAHGFMLRLIEPMPLGASGRTAQGADLSALGERLAAERGLLPQVLGAGAGPARYWAAPGGASLGVITPMSQHFCAACNRVRLTVDGRLLLCLGQEDEVPLGALLRAGASDSDLVAAIRAGIGRKPREHEFGAKPLKLQRVMAQTGG